VASAPTYGRPVHVAFTRSGREVVVVAHRDDGVMLQTKTTTGKGGLLPHDLEHFVVENAVGLTSGLWGRVAAGAEFNSFTVLTDKPRRRPRSHGRSLTKGMSGWDEHIIGVAVSCYRAAVASGWTPPGRLPPSLPIERDLARVAGTVERDFTRADVERACVALHDALGAWESTPEGGTLSRPWTVRRSYASPARKRG
jgi:hypothetical protein